MAKKPETAAERRARLQAEAAARGEARGEDFRKARAAERSYGAALRTLANQIRVIIEAHAPAKGDPWDHAQLVRLQHAMAAYAQAITPWAQGAAQRMLTEVNRRDVRAWERYTVGMGADLRRALASTPLGPALRTAIALQVHYITSLPVEAAQRVMEKAQEAQIASARYPERTSEIEEALADAHPDASAAWLRNRATLIARTETARAASLLTQARAQHIGSETYTWRTAGDWNVRASHKRLDNTVHRWDDPPVSDKDEKSGKEYRAHPGQIWNCRCVAIPHV